MADKKRSLADSLSATQSKPQLRRGGGMRLSIEDAPTDAETQERTSAEMQNSEIAQSHNRTIARSHDEPKRVNRGYKLREDLIKAFKRIALEEDRKMYEVMEDALEEYLDRHVVG